MFGFFKRKDLFGSKVLPNQPTLLEGESKAEPISHINSDSIVDPKFDSGAGGSSDNLDFTAVIQDVLIDLEKVHLSKLDQEQTLLEQINVLKAELSDKKKNIEILSEDRNKIFEEKTHLEKEMLTRASDVLLRDDVEQTQQELQDEMDLLMEQINQNHVDLEKLYFENKDLKKKYEDLLGSLERQQKSSGGLDYGSLKIVAIDTVSDVQAIEWEVVGYNHTSGNQPPFRVLTGISDGIPSIELVGSKKTFSPSKIRNKEGEDTKSFLALTSAEWKQIQLTIQLFKSHIQNKWQGADLAYEFDPSFWNLILAKLCLTVDKLPPVLRFDQIKLKRELVHKDYEHLWIELSNLQLDDFIRDKFELRIAASMIEIWGFSKFPKFEFPLIDGKRKPFDSWYEESKDDYGGKYELRFSLEKGLFDYTTFKNISLKDQALIQSVILNSPRIIQVLIAEGVIVSRPLGDWSDFAMKSAVVFKKIISMASQQKREGLGDTPSANLSIRNEQLKTKEGSALKKSRSKRKPIEINVQSKKKIKG